MTQRTIARHRSDERLSTPLTELTGSLSVVPAVAGRGGLVIALSSGLAASVGMPAGELTRAEAATTSSIPVVSADAALAAAPVSAPASAQVDFEHPAFHADARQGSAAMTPAAVTREVTEVSRSLAGSAYRTELKVAAARQVAAARTAAEASRSVASRSAGTARHSLPAPAPAPVVRGSGSSRGASVVAIASRYLGIPYVYGGSSPRGFDCSGLTQYVYAQLGVSLPRTAAAQYGATTRIARSQAVPGDLIFFFTGGTVTHVAIYLGGNMMLAAPHTGDVVKKESIYSANIAFGRV